MALTKHQLKFNSTVGKCDEVKTFLYSSDGTALTQTGGALDVNIAASDISISVAESDVYAEDTAHTSGDDGAFMLAVRRDTRAVGSDADGDYSSLNVNAVGELWVKDADVLAQLQAGVVISDGGSSLPPYDLAVGATEAYATLETALAAATNGQTILVRSGTYLVSTAIAVNKEVKIIGESRADVIFETAGGSSDPVNVFNVTANNVVLAQMTIKHKKSSNTSIEAAVVASGSGFPQTRISNFLLASCTVEYLEMGLSVRAENWCARDCTFTYATGSASNSNRAIVIYGTKGNAFIKDNLLKNDVLNGTSFRPFYLTSTTGINPHETVEGKLVIEGNTHVGALAQFFNQDNNQSAGAGTFELQIKNNVTEETNLFAGFFAGAANAGDMFSSITLENNTISNLHALDGGKGMFGVYGTATFRSTSLVLHASGNVFGQTVFRTGWMSVDTELVGKETATPAFTVSKDAIIPASGTAPSVLLSTASNSITVDAVDFDIRDLSHTQDSIRLGDGTDFLAINADGSLNITDNGSSLTVDATDLDIRDLTAASDSVAAWAHDGTGNALESLNGNLKVVNCTDTVTYSSQALTGGAAATAVAAISGQSFVEIQNLSDEPVYMTAAGATAASPGILIPCGGTWSGEVCGAVNLYSDATIAAADLQIAQYALS